MADVRLTATNPDDSTVVPVACDAQGRLLVEPPQVVEGPQGDPGEKGDPGEQGEPGPQGDPGLDAPQWEYGTWTPEYGSTESEASLLIQYSENKGDWFKLGNMVWVKAYLATSAVAILEARGLLVIKGFPFTWDNTGTQQHAGCSIDYVANFSGNIIYPFARGPGSTKIITPWKVADNGAVVSAEVIDLQEHGVIDDAIYNRFRFSFFGSISSTDTPSLKYENGKLVGMDF
jgi:hypothetical protein